MDWQFRKTLKINQEMSTNQTWQSYLPSEFEFRICYLETLKQTNKKTPPTPHPPSVGSMSNLTACFHKLSRPLGAQASDMGRLSKALPRHMSTMHYRVLGCARVICLKRRHSPPTKMCVHPRRSPITQSESYAILTNGAFIHNMRGDADISVPRDDLQPLEESPSNLKESE